MSERHLNEPVDGRFERVSQAAGCHSQRLKIVDSSLSASLSGLLKRLSKGVAALRSPSFAAAMFSIKTFGAALVALYLALWLGLDQPKWALMTVFIVSQPESGLVLAKSVFRMLGTIAGTLVSVMLVFVLSQYGDLFLTALALWVGLCSFAARAVRNFASYGFLLAGYTAAIVGLPAALNPAGAYPLLLARFTEILLGIVCAGLVSRLILPRELLPVIIARTRELTRHIERFAELAVDSNPRRNDLGTERVELVKGLAAIDAMRVAAVFESPDALLLGGALRHWVEAAVHFVAASKAAMTVFGSRGPPPPTRAWTLGALVAATEDTPCGNGAVLSALAQAERRRVVHDALLRLQCLKVSYDVESITTALRAPRQRWSDPTQALATGLRSALAIIVTSGFWFVTAWPSGPIAVITAGTVCTLFGGTARQMLIPVAATITLLIAAVPVFVTDFYLLPAATDFVGLSVALAPLLLVCGFLMATQPIALLPIVYFAISSNLNNSMSYDAVSYLNTLVAIFFGFGVSFMLFAVIFPESSLRRIGGFRRQLLIQLCQFSADTRLKLEEYELTLFDEVAVALEQDPSAAGEYLRSAAAVVPTARAIVRLRDALGTEQLAPDIGVEVSKLLERISQTDIRHSTTGFGTRAWEARLLGRRALARARNTIDVTESEALGKVIVGCEALRSSLLGARLLMSDS
ncbi:FUSC family protein [Bradyrhizobium genosp. A]|uniref:FUSC family protein n=1 Tax=Bradyrhizobium genosp. A TaxID=83626 RepID=UPI003CEA4A9F